MTLREAYEYGVDKLQESGITNAKQDSFYLLEFVTGINRGKYYTNEQSKMSKEEQKEYISLIDKRRMRVPLQHLIGITEFMGLPFKVNSHVLIPRQDTEVLVETALEVIRKYKIGGLRRGRKSQNLVKEEHRTKPEIVKSKIEGLRILDMCTGSGCILISTLYYGVKEFPKILGVGVDISKEALEVSKENAILNGFNVRKVESLKDLVYNDCKDIGNEPEIILLESDLFAKLDVFDEDSNNEEKYNIILSNPPYIPTNRIESLEEEVKSHDPKLALDGGEDGLYYYQQIIEKSREYLVDEGYLILECGWDQSEEISKMMKEEGFVDVEIIKDLSGLDRVVLGNIN
jgi:release factor glutamine methyltransferase